MRIRIQLASYIAIYIYICVCVCVCVCARDRSEFPHTCTYTVQLVSCPDPTLCEGKGSGEFGHNPWARERNLSAPMRLQL